MSARLLSPSAPPGGFPQTAGPIDAQSQTIDDQLKAPYTMTKGGYMIVMKNGKVSQKFGSEAKKRRFAEEDRRGHRSEYRKLVGKGLRLGPNKKNHYVLRAGEKPNS